MHPNAVVLVKPGLQLTFSVQTTLFSSHLLGYLLQPGHVVNAGVLRASAPHSFLGALFYVDAVRFLKV